MTDLNFRVNLTFINVIRVRFRYLSQSYPKELTRMILMAHLTLFPFLVRLRIFLIPLDRQNYTEQN